MINGSTGQKGATAMKRTQNSIRWLSALGVLSVSIGIAAAQSGSISGMYVFPKGGQPPEQQRQDEGECNGSAIEMTGFNPAAPQSAPGAPAGSGARGAVRGAAGGAALGAAMGAISGDAGKGAAMGAAGGG